MLGQYFYHEILRKTVIGFGTLFNGIEIRHDADDGASVSRMKVPLAYGPMQKFLAKIEQQPTLKGRPAITLPRMSFEMTTLNYDPSRKASITQTFRSYNTGNLNNTKKVFMPVPYNVGFMLSIATKLNDDMLQIMEQILPYFQPGLSITLNLVSSINEKRDIPIVLESINMSDDYEGSFDNRRAMITTMQFTAKVYLFGAVADNPDGLIKRVNVDYFTDTNKVVAKREQRYSATPRAVKDYNDDNTTAINKPLGAEKTRVDVNSAANFSVDDYIRIGEENMQIRVIDGDSLVVYRGVDGTTATDHVAGSVIDILSGSRDATLPLTGDDALIASGDDFGFNEMSSFYEDFKQYSPSQQKDV